MGKPIGERVQPQVVYSLEIIGRIGELAEDLGIIEMAGTILGGDVLKSPDGNQVKQDKAGYYPVEEAKTCNEGAQFDRTCLSQGDQVIVL